MESHVKPLTIRLDRVTRELLEKMCSHRKMEISNYVRGLVVSDAFIAGEEIGGLPIPGWQLRIILALASIGVVKYPTLEQVVPAGEKIAHGHVTASQTKKLKREN